MDSTHNTTSTYKLVPIGSHLYLVYRRKDNLCVANVGPSYEKSAPWQLRFTDFFSNKVELNFRTLAELRAHLEHA